MGERARYFVVWEIEPCPEFPVRDGLSCAEIRAFDDVGAAIDCGQRNRPAVVRRGEPTDAWLAEHGLRRVGG